MNVRHSLVRFLALTVVASMPLLGMATVASAKASSKYCTKHPTSARCSTTGSGGTGGTPPTPPPLSVTVSPGSAAQPLVETGQSEVYAVVEVETSSSFAGDTVNISSSQLDAVCAGGITFETLQGRGVPTTAPITSAHEISVVLDDDGNATVVVDGSDCAPGDSVIEADLTVAPYYTGLATLYADPPDVTPVDPSTGVGLEGYPMSTELLSGTSVPGEVETGDTTASGFSDVYLVFYVETSPVYAEQTVDISSAQLQDSCGQGWLWEAGNGGTGITSASTPGSQASAPLDDDGNAVFRFEGSSCAAGVAAEVIADVDAGTHATETLTYTIQPPEPTI